tara:strand:+ start:821 stop:2182 length:1362 start_codon:yes stop_codon:yes gene_type:complete
MTKIFGTDGIRGFVNCEPLTAETCLKISKSVASLIKQNKYRNQRVVICKDTRLSGYLYEPLITAGFISMGIDVILVGPLPTPSLPLLIKTLRADLGVMITASHNTFEFNGLKFFNASGLKLDSKTEKKVEKIILNNNLYKKITNKIYKSGKAFRLEDASGRYSEYLKSVLNKHIEDKKNYKIVLDCANGATYNVAPSIFWELGHEVIPIHCNPNGKNINHNCGAVNVKDLIKNVISNKADIGFAFDGDGDRLIVVDEKGLVVDGDKILALFAKHYINKKNHKNKKIVISTVMSNLGFENYLKKDLKISLKRTKVGDINVINEMHKNKSILGGEQSGHIILSEFSNTGDGILAALKITEIMNQTNEKASQIFDLYEEYPQKKINISYKKNKKQIENKINNLAKKIKLSNKNFRTLIRFSGTEPLIRILVEGSDNNKVEFLANKIKNEVRSILDK